MWKASYTVKIVKFSANYITAGLCAKSAFSTHQIAFQILPSSHHLDLSSSCSITHHSLNLLAFPFFIFVVWVALQSP